METLRVFKQTISKHKKELKRRYHLKTIGLFGSYVRGHQKKGSDVDMLVDFEHPISLFDFIELEDYLEKILSTKVDLVSRKALKPYIGKQILKEIRYL